MKKMILLIAALMAITFIGCEQTTETNSTDVNATEVNITDVNATDVNATDVNATEDINETK